MTKKSSRELLFERMEAVNPDFKRPQENVPNTEQEIVDDILSLNEGIDSVLNKIKEYGKRGLLTAAILLAVALGANAQEQEYEQIMSVGREYSKGKMAKEPTIDIDSSGVYHIGNARYTEPKMTNADFNITDVNYFYLALAVQQLNKLLPNQVKTSPKIDTYGDELRLSSEEIKANNAYDVAMDLYNILQSNQSDAFYDKMNSTMFDDLIGAGRVSSRNNDSGYATAFIRPDNGINRIKAYIANGKNIKLVDGKFVGGLNPNEAPSPAQ